MDSIDAWRDLIERLLIERAALPYDNVQVQSRLVFDRARDSYMLVEVGWQEQERMHGIHLHLDIIDGRIWIQYDGTEHGFAHDLVAAGVPKDRIVLGFRPPQWRAHTGYAAA
jgi:hypothetical protein